MAVDRPANPLTSPFGLEDDDGYTWLKGNLHAHTTNSDGKATPQERVDLYAEQGYGFLCLADHNDITRIDSLACPDGMVLIQGVELHPENPFGGSTHHFVALNVDQDMDAKRMPPQLVIDEVNEQGGSIWLAHPHWSSVKIMREILPLHGFAGFEVFNSICSAYGRGESAVHWDDWMELENRLYPALANDDCHSRDGERGDAYRGWTMARVQDPTAAAVVEALEKGMCYASTGPEIHDIRLQRVDEAGDEQSVVEATVRCSEAQRVAAVCNQLGAEYREVGGTFESATFRLFPGSRWARFEVIGPDGSKAWSNPFDLTGLER